MSVVLKYAVVLKLTAEHLKDLDNLENYDSLASCIVTDPVVLRKTLNRSLKATNKDLIEQYVQIPSCTGSQAQTFQSQEDLKKLNIAVQAALKRELAKAPDEPPAEIDETLLSKSLAALKIEQQRALGVKNKKGNPPGENSMKNNGSRSRYILKFSSECKKLKKATKLMINKAALAVQSMIGSPWGKNSVAKRPKDSIPMGFTCHRQSGSRPGKPKSLTVLILWTPEMCPKHAPASQQLNMARFSAEKTGYEL